VVSDKSFLVRNEKGERMRATHRHRSSGVVTLVVGLALLCGPARAGSSPVSALTPAPAVHPHRIIVKYRPTVTACAHCLLAHGTRFASVTGTDSLDRLDGRYGVRGAQALFFDYHGAQARSAAYMSGVDAVRSRFAARTARAAVNAPPPDLSNIFVLDLGAGVNPVEAAKAFAKDPDVEYAEPDYRMHATFTPNDPYLPLMWGLQATQAPVAWDTANGANIVVAVIDTGVNYLHTDLKQNVWTNSREIPGNHIDDDGNGFVDDVYGWDFVKNRKTPKDRHGHGTHVAGTIAATGNNGRGVIGMAWGARVMAVRGLDARGYGYSSDLAKGILYAARNGADVLNNSWGGFGSASVDAAIDTATSLGAVVVFAAGNDDSQYLGQAANPKVIAVAASDTGDARASFSNYGPQISVAAPGVNILSLRGPGRLHGQVVGGKYRYLSGTSMAAPHVSGVVALLLAQHPGLTLDEVRWHLELNADQPGYPGYEGQPWNPYFGWGRINAARVFEAPPVTTRISAPPPALHGFAGDAVDGLASVGFLFTTLDPIAWSIVGPPWLTPTIPSGTGPATVPLTLDGTGLAIGTYNGSVAVTAPAAANGGASVAATAHLHRDNRSGGQITVTDSYYPWGYGTVRLTGDGQGALAVWVDWPPGSPSLLKGAYIDDDGTVGSPFVINTGTCDFFCSKKDPDNLAVAFDGTNFLVVWNERLEQFVSELSLKTKNYRYVRAVRVTRGGQVLDATPIQLALTIEPENSRGGFDQYDYGFHVAFDGAAYTAIWGMLDYGSARNAVQVFMRRVGADGSLPTAVRKIYPVATTAYPQYIEPKIACLTGSCLVAWHEADGEIGPGGKYIDKLYGQRYSGDQPVDALPFRILTDMEDITLITTGGGGYFLAGLRALLDPGPPRSVGWDMVGVRVSAGGTPLDPNGIRLNNSAAPGLPVYPEMDSVAFDGTTYIVTFGERGPLSGYGEGLCYPFAVRVGLDGTVLDNEPEGLLLASPPVLPCNRKSLVVTATQSLLVWDESGTAPKHIFAQPVFRRD